MEKGERFFQGAIHLTCFRHLFIDEMTHSLEMLIYLNFGNIHVTPFLVSVGIGKYFIHHRLRDFKCIKGRLLSFCLIKEDFT